MNLVLSTINRLEKLGLMLGSLSILLLILLVIAVRFTGNSIYYAEELVRLVFVWVVFFGFSYGISHEQHIRVTLFIDYLKPEWKRYFNHLSKLISFLFCAVLLWEAGVFSFKLYSFGQLTPALEFSIACFYLAAVVGFFFACCHLVFGQKQTGASMLCMD